MYCLDIGRTSKLGGSMYIAYRSNMVRQQQRAVVTAVASNFVLTYSRRSSSPPVWWGPSCWPWLRTSTPRRRWGGWPRRRWRTPCPRGSLGGPHHEGACNRTWGLCSTLRWFVCTRLWAECSGRLGTGMWAPAGRRGLLLCGQIIMFARAWV